ncbi:MAG: isoprenylcysteine carboxylmethyltransferase family protein [Sphingomonadales bacterium]|nr:isoprenylcysteine carboxylmethyltransferase family protein [Sphingomonadales bacterium]
MRAIDLPPLWLAHFAAAGWGVAQIVPVALPGGGLVGRALVGVGLALMATAAAQMVARHTTFIPRRDPAALVTGGVFALSRNPIYLADALVLSGLLILWQGVLALPLVPAFMALITRRFILGEEARIAAHFGADYAAYCSRTRRWL